MRRLFIDPASISSGWALFDGSRFIASGTVRAEKKDLVFDRLLQIWKKYRKTATQLDEIHLERLPRSCHHYTIWSVGVIGTALAETGAKILDDVSPRSWQKFCRWTTRRDDRKVGYRLEAGSPLIPFVPKVESDDELSAVGIGLYYLSKEAA